MADNPVFEAIGEVVWELRSGHLSTAAAALRLEGLVQMMRANSGLLPFREDS